MGDSEGMYQFHTPVDVGFEVPEAVQVACRGLDGQTMAMAQAMERLQEATSGVGILSVGMVSIVWEISETSTRALEAIGRLYGCSDLDDGDEDREVGPGNGPDGKPRPVSISDLYLATLQRENEPQFMGSRMFALIRFRPISRKSA